MPKLFYITLGHWSKNLLVILNHNAQVPCLQCFLLFCKGYVVFKLVVGLARLRRLELKNFPFNLVQKIVFFKSKL